MKFQVHDYRYRLLRVHLYLFLKKHGSISSLSNFLNWMDRINCEIVPSDRKDRLNYLKRKLRQIASEELSFLAMATENGTLVYELKYKV